MVIAIIAGILIVPNSSVPQADAVAGIGGSNCGGHYFDLIDDLGAGSVISSIGFAVRPPAIDIVAIEYQVRWFNWTSAMNGISPSSGILEENLTFNPPGVTASKLTAITTGPGYVTGVLTGFVYVSLPAGPLLACWIIPTSANTIVSGGSFSENDIALPITADANNDNLSDIHCDICDKKEDELTEKRLYERNRKVCDALDTPLLRPQPFKPCKQSANRSVYDDHASKYADEWYDVNRNGWVGPTDPSNKPDGWTGAYYTGKGYNHPNMTPTPLAVPTHSIPRPTPSYTSCNKDITTGVITCDSWDGGDVHILSVVPYIDATPPVPTPAATTTPVATPTAAPLSISINVAEIDPNKNVTVSWSGMPSPTTSDKIMLYKDNSTPPNVAVWKYTNSCTTTADTDTVASGNCTVLIPSNLTHGHYKFRLVREGWEVLQTSGDLWVEDGCVRYPNNCSE